MSGWNDVIETHHAKEDQQAYYKIDQWDKNTADRDNDAREIYFRDQVLIGKQTGAAFLKRAGKIQPGKQSGKDQDRIRNAVRRHPGEFPKDQSKYQHR